MTFNIIGIKQVNTDINTDYSIKRYNHDTTNANIQKSKTDCGSF